MSIAEKIDYIIENEGCEYAEGLDCLLTFSNYCGVKLSGILPLIQDDVDRIYEELIEEQKEQERTNSLCKYSDIPPGVMFQDSNAILYFLTVDGPYYLSGKKSTKDFLPDDLVAEIKV